MEQRAKKKSLKKNFKKIKQVNHACVELIENLKERYVFTTDEEQRLNSTSEHIINMSVLFTDMEKGLK